MSLSYVTAEGEQPGNEGFATLAAAFRAWSQRPDKETKFVIEADLFGNPTRQLSHEESERIARESLDPKVK